MGLATEPPLSTKHSRGGLCKVESLGLCGSPRRRGFLHTETGAGLLSPGEVRGQQRPRRPWLLPAQVSRVQAALSCMSFPPEVYY